MLVGAACCTAAAIAVANGQYSPLALGAVLVAFIFGVAALRAFPRPGSQPIAEDGPDLTRTLCGALAVLLIIGAFDEPGIYLRRDRLALIYAIHQRLFAGAGLLLLVRRLLKSRGASVADEAPIRHVASALVLTALVLRLGIIIEVPAPAIDVWWQLQDSARHLLAGLNPYTTPVSDPTDAASRYGYFVPAYVYPPSALIVQLPAYALLGDVRYAAVVADAVAAAALYRIAAPAGRTTALLIAAIFLHQPRSLFIIEQAWQEPIIFAALAVAAAAGLSRGRAARWFGAAVGAAVGMKQHMVFFFAAFAFARRRNAQWIGLLAAAALPWIPFLIWDAVAAVQNGVLFQFSTPFRPDGLTVAAAAYAAFGLAPPKAVAAIVGTAMMLLCSRRLAGDSRVSAWLYGGTLATFAAFLVGTQAFANYYHLLASCFLLILSVRRREEHDASMG